MEEVNKIDGIFNAPLCLYMITKDLKLLIKYLRSTQPTNPSPERCLKLVLEDNKHFYEHGGGLSFVHKSEELQGICVLLLNLIQLFNSNVSHIDDGCLESSDELMKILDAKPFLKSYLLEMKREQVVITDCSAKLKVDLSASNLVKGCGLLKHLSKHLISDKFNYEDVRNLLKINIQANDNIFEPTNPNFLIAKHEIVLLDQLMLIKLFLEEVLSDNTKADDTINRMKNILKSIKSLKDFNEVIQMLFQLLFLRNEDIKSIDEVGFVCNQVVIEKLLNFLKISQLQKVHSKEYAAAEAVVQVQFDQRLEHIKNALLVLALFNGETQQKSELALVMVNLKSTNLFCTPKAQQSSSDDDEKVSSKKYSTYPRKRLPKKKVPLKSDGTGSGTSIHLQGSSSFPNHEDEQMPQANNINIVSKMCGSPDSLMAVCLYNNDLGNVRQIIKVSA
jgi:hypothetical protein